MTDTTYNCWTNRETWLTSMYYDETADMLLDQASSRDEFTDMVEAELQAEFSDAEDAIYGIGDGGPLPPLIRDLMPDLDDMRRKINVEELVEAWTEGGDWCDECDTFFRFEDTDHKGRMVTNVDIDGTETYTCGNCVNEEDWQ